MVAVLDRVSEDQAVDLAKVAKVAATETEQRETAHKDETVKALNKAWAGADDVSGKVQAAFQVTQRVIRRADTVEDKVDAARALVRLLDGAHKGKTVEQAEAEVEAAQGVLVDVNRVRATRNRLAALLVGQGVPKGTVAEVCGVSEGMVDKLRQTDAIRAEAKKAGKPITVTQAKEIVRAGKLTAARAAMKEGKPATSVLPTPEVKKVTSATADLAATLARAVKSLPSITVTSADAGDVAKVAAAAAALTAWAESHAKTGKPAKTA